MAQKTKREAEEKAWEEAERQKVAEKEKRKRRTVVATTHQNGTRSLLTSAKLSVGYLVVGITRELNKEPSLHCSSIYINYM